MSTYVKVHLTVYSYLSEMVECSFTNQVVVGSSPVAVT